MNNSLIYKLLVILSFASLSSSFQILGRACLVKSKILSAKTTITSRLNKVPSSNISFREPTLTSTERPTDPSIGVFLHKRLVGVFQSIRLVFLVTCFWIFLCQTGWAVTGGRVGGSFGKSDRSSAPRMGRMPSTRLYGTSRPPPVRVHHYYAPPSPIRINQYAPPILIRPPPRRQAIVQSPAPEAPLRVRDSSDQVTVIKAVRDVAIVVGLGALVVYAMRPESPFGNGVESPLGTGATVATITLSLNVPDRTQPDCILERLKRLALNANTATRKGVQDLVTEVCLELARQGRSIVSASTESNQFASVRLAERDFQRKSIVNRSKFDREGVNKFGDSDLSEPPAAKSSSSEGSSRATSAIVSINVAIEGDSTLLPVVRNRQSVLDALSRLASDAQVGDCLLSAEILWVPEQPEEVLTTEDVYADYPNLIPF